MTFSLIPLPLALCRFTINTSVKRPAPKGPRPKCPRAQTAAAKVTYPSLDVDEEVETNINLDQGFRTLIILVLYKSEA